MINSLSIIIQGEVLPHINRQLAEIRKIFSHAEIIVSTCSKPKVDIFGADKVIVSDDPGFFYYSKREDERLNNVNRQIVNTLAGIKAATKDYVFKLRSDFLLNGKDFLNYFEQFPLFDEKYKVFEHKILACSYFSRNPRDKRSYPFHPSDLVFFGKRVDLLNLFDIPLMSKEEAYYSFSTPLSNKYVPEQYIFISCLRKNGKKIDCNLYNDISGNNIEETERYFASNFIFLTFEQFNLIPTKDTFDKKLHLSSFQSCITPVEWQKLYQKYVDDSFVAEKKDAERASLNKMQLKYKIFRLLSNIFVFPIRNKTKRKNLRFKLLKLFMSF